MDDESSGFVQQIASKASRRLRAQSAGVESSWSGLGTLGVVGWSVAAPTLLGGFLGVWLDKHHPGGHSWTLALLGAGLALGCANAWFWVAQQHTAIVQQIDGPK
jgi:ATP synthase protein I